MTTRRRFLAGLGTGAISAFAGCGALDRLNEQPEGLRQEDLAGWTPATLIRPSALPFSLPESLFETQEQRAQDLLAAVPADPDVPNATIREQIKNERTHVQDRIQEEADMDTDIGRLKHWHSLRSDAAEVFGTYRAATGKDDASIVADRRERVRDEMASFESDLEYSAASTLEAVLAYEPVEERLERAKHELPPRDPYPENPVSNVEQAGRAYKAIESAAAALQEAQAIRAAFESARESAEPRWGELAAAERWLEISVDRTRSDRIPYPESADPDAVFAFELSEVERELYRFARRGTQHLLEASSEAGDDNQFATAVVLAGRCLSSIAAFEGVITAIKNGDLPDEQTAESIQNAASTAHETLQDIPAGEYPFLSASIGKPAVLKYQSGVRSAGTELFDPEYAEASFRYAALLGAATNESAAFVVDQLESYS